MELYVARKFHPERALEMYKAASHPLNAWYAAGWDGDIGEFLTPAPLVRAGVSAFALH
jgi:hypothetical protein